MTMTNFQERKRKDQLLVLAAISDGHKYGYDISKATGLQPSRMYPALWDLENNNILIGEFEDGPEPRRRFYKPA